MHRTIPLARAARRSNPSLPAAKIIHVSYWGSVSRWACADAQRPSERSLMLTPSPPAWFRLVRATCALGEAPVRSTALTHAGGSCPEAVPFTRIPLAIRPISRQWLPFAGQFSLAYLWPSLLLVCLRGLRQWWSRPRFSC